MAVVNVVGVVFYSGEALAQSASSYDTVNAAVEQTNGQYSEMDLSHLASFGMQQKAWNNPMEHLGEGQTKPGYSRYQWSPDLVLPLRLREGMVTLINFPSWEYIDTVWLGDQGAFATQFAAPNALLVYAEASSGFIGVDTNMIVFGRSGNRYTFYLRSETFNTDRITNTVVDIVVNDPNHTPDDTGMTPVASGTTVSGMGGGGARTAQSARGSIGKPAPKPGGEGWLDDIPVDPEKLKFDIDVFVPDPNDIDIAPERVWRDEIFTYIDLGPKALTMLERPIVNLLIQGSETPVGFRTRGPHSRLIVVEAIGDMVLRNGQSVICLRIRKDPSFGTDWVEYEPSVQKTHVPAPIGPESFGKALQQTSALKTSPMNMQGGMYMKNTSTNVPMTAEMAIVGMQGQGYNAVAAQKVATENISVELGASDSISSLEKEWNNISRKNKDVLEKYSPYYSMDASAEGNASNVFRLRIGPMKSLKEGDALCRKLGPRGVTCSVVRTQ